MNIIKKQAQTPEVIKKHKEIEKYAETDIKQVPKELVEDVLFYKNSIEELKDAAKQLSERQFMQLVEYSSWTVEESLEFYHKHCK